MNQSEPFNVTKDIALQRPGQPRPRALALRGITKRRMSLNPVPHIDLCASSRAARRRACGVSASRVSFSCWAASAERKMPLHSPITGLCSSAHQGSGQCSAGFYTHVMITDAPARFNYRVSVLSRSLMSLLKAEMTSTWRIHLECSLGMAETRGQD